MNITHHKNGVITTLMDDQERLRKYEMRNLAQCDRIAVLEAQNKQKADKIAQLKQIIDANNLNQNIGQFVKPLSDEEIEAIITDCGYQIEETVTGKFVDIEGINMYNSFKGFAKAIEAKVRGEK
jgi:hypothetical protein